MGNAELKKIKRFTRMIKAWIFSHVDTKRSFNWIFLNEKTL